MIDIFFIILTILSLGYIIFIIIKKFPNIINIDINNLPDYRHKLKKEEILKQRIINRFNKLIKGSKEVLLPLNDTLKDSLKEYYQKLKKIEQDLKNKSYEKLDSSLDKSKLIDDLIKETKDYIAEQNYKEAEIKLLDALKIDAYNQEVYKILADVYTEQKEYEQAKETLGYLLKLTHNDDAAVFSSLANLARERGNLKEAEEEYLKSISLSSDNYLYFISLAEVYLELEEYKYALETAQRALILSGNNPKILDFLINISIIIQDKELALKYLDKLKEVNPDNKKIGYFNEKIDGLD